MQPTCLMSGELSSIQGKGDWWKEPSAAQLACELLVRELIDRACPRLLRRRVPELLSPPAPSVSPALAPSLPARIFTQSLFQVCACPGAAFLDIGQRLTTWLAMDLSSYLVAAGSRCPSPCPGSRASRPCPWPFAAAQTLPKLAALARRLSLRLVWRLVTLRL